MVSKHLLVGQLALAALELSVFGGLPVSPTLHMILATTLTVYIGCLSSIPTSPKAEVVQRESAMTNDDAARLPLMSGAVLVGLWAIIKYGGADAQQYLLLALKVYFIGIGVVAVGKLVNTFMLHVLDNKKPLFVIPVIPYLTTDPEPITLSRLVSTILGAGVAYWYGQTNHWLSNNFIGIAFCVVFMQYVNIGSFPVAAAVLGALFAYDIAMVFGSGALLSWFAGKREASIMEVVATKIDGPIKLLFPLPHVIDPTLEVENPERKFSLIGLGDIVFPGLLLVLLIRFDVHLAYLKECADEKAALKEKEELPENTSAYSLALAQETGEENVLHINNTCPKLYFNTGIIFYVLGLISTVVSMYLMETAQPALLYLVPAVLLGPLILALVRGDVKQLFAFEDKDKESILAEKKDNSKTGTDAIKQD